jgi:hypothetical protein
MNRTAFKYYCERLYPYILSFVSVTIIYKSEIDILCSNNLNDMLGAVITLESIIIGFLGAIMPVILSMKNESKFVRYVFEKDRKHLFLKYIKITIKFGLLSAALTIILYLQDIINNDIERKVVEYIWLFVTISFFCLTYRCMVYMIILIFSDDSEIFSNVPNNIELESERIKNFKEQHKRKF